MLGRWDASKCVCVYTLAVEFYRNTRCMYPAWCRSLLVRYYSQYVLLLVNCSEFRMCFDFITSLLRITSLSGQAPAGFRDPHYKGLYFAKLNTIGWNISWLVQIS